MHREGIAQFGNVCDDEYQVKISLNRGNRFDKFGASVVVLCAETLIYARCS
ncbi:MAG: hypothetical protein AAFN11_05075 [Chloroflexota bacterium]